MTVTVGWRWTPAADLQVVLFLADIVCVSLRSSITRPEIVETILSELPVSNHPGSY